MLVNLTRQHGLTEVGWRGHAPIPTRDDASGSHLTRRRRIGERLGELDVRRDHVAHRADHHTLAWGALEGKRHARRLIAYAALRRGIQLNGIGHVIPLLVGTLLASDTGAEQRAMLNGHRLTKKGTTCRKVQT